MSDLMLLGVLRMPYGMAMGGEIARIQFYERAQQAADRIEQDAARIEQLEAELERARRPRVKLDPALKAALDEAAKTRSTTARLPGGEVAFINYGDQPEDTAHLCCTACGGSGHIDDQRVIAAAAATESHDVKSLDAQITALRRRRDSLPVQYSERFDLAVEIDKLEARRKEMTVETEVLAGAVWKAPISTASQVDPRQATPPGRWSDEVPTEAGHYWHWNGRQESRPVLIAGMYDHWLQRLVGAGGEPLAMLRGYWWRVYQPPVSSALTPEYKAAQTAKNENASVMLANLSKPIEE